MSQKGQMSPAPSKNNSHFWRWRTVAAAVGLVALGLLFRWAGPTQEPTPVFIPFSEAPSVVKAHDDAPRELLRLSSGEAVAVTGIVFYSVGTLIGKRRKK